MICAPSLKDSLSIKVGLTGWIRSLNAVPEWLYPGKEI
jgi:hypothetical protein